MRTYLVTGGAGFIGSNYIHYMFQKYGDSIRIINVDALTYAGNLANLKDIEDRDNYTFIKADICDKEAIAEIFARNDIDRVVHFAAESHVDRSIRTPEVFVQTNVLGTAVMLNCAKAAWELPDGSFREDKKFLHVSTDEVYGALGPEGYFTETSTALFRRTTMPFSTRPLLTIPTVRTRPARLPRTCWSSPIWTHTVFRPISQIAPTITGRISFRKS